MSHLHIRAVGDHRAAYLDDAGRPVAGRYAGRDRVTFDALPDGERVPDSTDIRRALARGDLALVEPVAPKPATTTKPATP